MPNRRFVLWQGLASPSLERMIMTESEGGFELAGIIIQAAAGTSYVARYFVHVDGGWRTLDAMIEVENGTRRSVSLTRTPSGQWVCDGRAMPALHDCVDVDLEWTPATNTLPIRRLSLDAGGPREATAAWVRFPSLMVEPLVQSYERLGRRRYRYRSGAFSADLEVDDDGLVLQYGTNWQAVAVGGGS
ncbi:MAG: hypothetical protein E6I88_00745 [Chloroflexi bacterium]|nr:MAG: hypothetical protein E6I88_00745 [Chloroflexota bacterium]TME46246.1 MAG: hypothetical protein E6I56_07645 [Chloroflexota bacterium]